MSRILLVDDSPHAQRMGERILSEEGYEVVTVSNADSALIRLEDVDPDVVLADTVMPGRTGYEICQYLKMNPRHRHVRVVLTAGVLENFDEEQLKRVEADATLKKPFEASALVAAVKPLADAAAAARADAAPGSGGARKSAPAPAAAPFVAVVDAEQVRAAVTLALDASMESMIDEIARRVVAAFQSKPAESEAKPVAPPLPRNEPLRPLARTAPLAAAPAAPPPPALRSAVAPIPAAPAPATPALTGPAVPPVEGVPPPAPSGAHIMETVRRVTKVRARPGSILGLDADSAASDQPPAPKR